jgi:hypothetical protein
LPPPRSFANWPAPKDAVPGIRFFTSDLLGPAWTRLDLSWGLLSPLNRNPNPNRRGELGSLPSGFLTVDSRTVVSAVGFGLWSLDFGNAFFSLDKPGLAWTCVDGAGTGGGKAQGWRMAKPPNTGLWASGGAPPLNPRADALMLALNIILKRSGKRILHGSQLQNPCP